MDGLAPPSYYSRVEANSWVIVEKLARLEREIKRSLPTTRGGAAFARALGVHTKLLPLIDDALRILEQSQRADRVLSPPA